MKILALQRLIYEPMGSIDNEPVETNRPTIVLARPKEVSQVPIADPVVNQMRRAEAVLD